MKTEKKVLCAIGAVLVAGTAGLLCFGGKLYYRKAQKEFTDYFLDWNPGEWPYSDKGTLPEGKQLTVNGISLNVPKELEQSPDQPVIYKSLSDAGEPEKMVLFAPPEEWGEFTFDDLNPLLEKRVEKYLHSVGQEMPHNEWDLHELLFTLKSEDGDTCNLIDAGIFYRLEKIKTEMIFPGNVHYLIHNPGAVGFVGIVKPNEETSNYKIFMDLYDPNDKNRSNEVIVTAPDLDTACQIANSAALVPYETADIIPMSED